MSGARDPAVPPVNAAVSTRLPKITLAIIEAGHFLWEDAADTDASLVTSGWSGGYAHAGHGSRR